MVVCYPKLVENGSINDHCIKVSITVDIKSKNSFRNSVGLL